MNGVNPIIRRLQKLYDGHQDMVIRSSMHVANRRKGLLPDHIKELQRREGVRPPSKL